MSQRLEIRRWIRAAAGAFLVLIPGIVVSLVPSGCAPTPSSRLVVLIRHAEKALEPAGDPVLTPEGVGRARALAVRLGDTRIDHIIASEFARTSLTAQFVADDRGIEVEIVSVGHNMDEHVRLVAAAVRAEPEGDAVLVVGHSNTIPAIVHALGGPSLPDLDDDDYDTMFLMVIEPNGRARTVRASFH